MPTDHSGSFPFLSVVVQGKCRADHLISLLYLFGYQDYPAEHRELLILDLDSENKQLLLENLVKTRFSQFDIRYLCVRERVASTRVHTLLKGDYVLLLDHHSFYAPQTFSLTLQEMKETGCQRVAFREKQVWYSHLDRLFTQPVTETPFCYLRQSDDCEQLHCLQSVPHPIEIAFDAQDRQVDGIPVGSRPLSGTLADRVQDPFLLAAYQRLKNTQRGPIAWEHVDCVLLTSDGEEAVTFMRSELLTLGVPEQKIVCVDPGQGALLKALQQCRTASMSLVLVLQGELQFLTQPKHIEAWNRSFSVLREVELEGILLGAQIRIGKEMSSLPELLLVRQCQAACAVLLSGDGLGRMLDTLKRGEPWPLASQSGRWLAHSPSLCYPRDEEAPQRWFRAPPPHPDSGQIVGFYMETTFHYQVYWPIILQLNRQGVACELVISDGINPLFVAEMLAFTHTLQDEPVTVRLISDVLSAGMRYRCVVSPYFTPLLQGLAEYHIRTLYGLAKESWNHAWWNIFYDRILCYSHYSQQALNIGGTAVAVGNPRFDAWYDPQLSAWSGNGKLDPAKPTLLYAPTFGALSSIPHWAKQLERLSRDFNVITKLHHGTLYREEEKSSLQLANRHLKLQVTDSAQTLPLLKRVDYVLTDNSGFIFDAIQAGKRTILLDWKGMKELLQSEQTFSGIFSPDQKIRQILPVVKDMEGLRHWLNDEAGWQQKEAELEAIRRHYCDAWQDGKAAERAAQVILQVLSERKDPRENTFLHSLRGQIFGG